MPPLSTILCNELEILQMITKHMLTDANSLKNCDNDLKLMIKLKYKELKTQKEYQYLEQLFDE